MHFGEGGRGYQVFFLRDDLMGNFEGRLDGKGVANFWRGGGV